MSRWKSPQAAAKRAERAAKRSAQLRKEKRKGWLLLGCVIFLMIAVVAADWLWIRSEAHRRHQQRYHASKLHTNDEGKPFPQTNGPHL